MPPSPSVHELEALAERVERHDEQIDKLSSRVDDLHHTLLTRLSEVMVAISQVGKAQELAEQRAALRLDSLNRLFEQQSESGKHWTRWVVATLVTTVLGGLGWLLGHYFH